MSNVLKFGGTSVGSASNMRKVATIIRKENARITVLSAMSGTTDALVKIASLAAQGNLSGIDEPLAMLRKNIPLVSPLYYSRIGPRLSNAWSKSGV